MTSRAGDELVSQWSVSGGDDELGRGGGHSGEEFVELSSLLG